MIRGPLVVACSFARPPLKKNDRLIWQAEHRFKVSLVDEGILRARSLRRWAATAGWSLPIAVPVTVRLVWTVTDPNRRRDASGSQRTLEPFLDGLVLGGLLLDDRVSVVRRAWCDIEAGDRESCRVEIALDGAPS